MRYFENSDILIQASIDYPLVISFTWKVETVHQKELIRYNDLLIDLARKHKHCYVIYFATKLKHVKKDNDIDLFNWSMQWYGKIVDAGVKKAAYVVLQCSQFGEEISGLKVHDFLEADEAYQWLLN